MSKIRLLLALVAASLCSVLSVEARIAPAMPEAQALESGKTYYLYNVGSDRFLYQSGSSSSVYAYTDKGAAVKVAAVNGTQYTLQFVNSNRYLYYGGSLTATSNSSTGYSYYRFTITETNGGYTLQRVYNAVDTLYLGYNGSTNDYIASDVMEKGNSLWQLLDADEAARFVAKRNLYRALESADGYTVDAYEAIYDDSTSTNNALQAAANKLNKAVEVSNSYTAPELSDYKVLFEMETNDVWTGSFKKSVLGGSTSTLSATVVVDGDATLYYYYNHDASTTSSGYLYLSFLETEVYLDGVLQYTISQGNDKYGIKSRYFLEMPQGKHIVTWRCNNERGYSKVGVECQIFGIGVTNTPTMTVNLKEGGSLGTEVLYKTDRIDDVRKLVVSGPMNSDDWSRILMMPELFSLDLTDAVISEIPDEQFGSNEAVKSVYANGYLYADDFYPDGGKLPYLHEVKLPTTLTRVGTKAFYRCYIDEMSFPDSLKEIGASAFAVTRIREAVLPPSVTNVGSSAFCGNRVLSNVVYPASAVNIPSGCFQYCDGLQSVTIPEGIKSIGNAAFRDSYSFDGTIPSTVDYIGDYAFYCAGTNGSIPSTLKYIGEYAFAYGFFKDAVIGEGCTLSPYAFQGSRLKTIVLPTTFYSDRKEMLATSKLKDVTFKSPTVVTTGNGIFGTVDMSAITLHVPSFLVNAYKQDAYWYNCNIVGFPTTDIKEWTVYKALKLGENDRLEGTPDIKVGSSASITISGDKAMPVNDLTVNRSGGAKYKSEGSNYTTYSSPYCSMLLMKDQNLSIEGKFRYNLYTGPKAWYYLCLPFDFKVGDITNNAGASYAIRYYDGATRAENGTSGNWKNWPTDSIIPAGTGFIYQTSKTTASYFTSQDNDSKQYGVSNKIFTKALAANPSETSSDKGWNFIGNPWACYYNIHKLNFVAPITVWNYNNKSYKAYSVIDDDYAIRPNEAFFVQCPDEVNSISFPIDGRQLDTKIESQNGAKPASTARQRRLINLQVVGSDSLADATRVVVNSLASLDYETSCDASKFMSLDRSVPQLYTIGTDGTQYAINERPEGDGTVTLGLKVARQGTYTIAATRSDIGSAILTDHELGQQADLSQGGYTFTADAGTYNDRFTLSLNGGGVTAIGSVESGKASVSVGDGAISVSGKATVYGIDGRKVAEVSDGSVNVPAGVYIVRSGKETVKVNVK